MVALVVFCGSYLKTLLDDVVDVTDEGVWFCDVVDTDVTEPLPRFLPANSYMSPNIPAKVLRKFFIVSSASSTTEVWLCGGGRDALVFELVDVCETVKMRKKSDINDDFHLVAVWSFVYFYLENRVDWC